MRTVAGMQCRIQQTQQDVMTEEKTRGRTTSLLDEIGVGMGLSGGLFAQPASTSGETLPAMDLLTPITLGAALALAPPPPPPVMVGGEPVPSGLRVDATGRPSLTWADDIKLEPRLDDLQVHGSQQGSSGGGLFDAFGGDNNSKGQNTGGDLVIAEDYLGEKRG